MHIIIIGGGFCGSTLAHLLDQHTNHTTHLIDPKPYFEYTPAIPKLLNQQNTLKPYIKHYPNFLKHIKTTTDTVHTITPTTIQTTQNTYPYDILVISPGSQYTSPYPNHPNILTIKHGESLIHHQPSLSKAKKILIIGGGLVGVETAAELATTYPQKNITLVHPHPQLIPQTHKLAQIYAKKFLEKHRVTILFNEKIQKIEDNTAITKKGHTIDFDKAIWCAGIQPTTLIFKDFKQTITTPNNAIKTNHYLQIPNYPTIFAGGDITAINEEKTAFNAERHAKTIYKNIISLSKQKNLKKYHKIPTLLVISLGSKNGILSHPYIVLFGKIPALAKILIEKYTLLNKKI